MKQARIGTRVRRQLRVFFNRAVLAQNMVAALTPDGAQTLLYSENGSKVLGIIRHKATFTNATRVGQASKHALLEDVYVNAVKAAGGSSLTQSRGGGISGGIGATLPINPVPLRLASDRFSASGPEPSATSATPPPAEGLVSG